jgi:hypothetical protein
MKLNPCGRSELNAAYTTYNEALNAVRHLSSHNAAATTTPLLLVKSANTATTERKTDMKT